MQDAISCGAVLFRIQNAHVEYLLIKQRSQRWAFPKGHIEDGETHQQTALREIFEETGYQSLLIEEFKEEILYESVNKLVYFFLAQSLGKQIKKPNPQEILDVQWYSFEQAAQTLGHPHQIELLQKAHNYIIQHFM
ncbi:MAG: bis(5'-nucleosyl)-tetraphosphatase [Candidatus Woesearchaeota archaeon]